MKKEAKVTSLEMKHHPHCYFMLSQTGKVTSYVEYPAGSFFSGKKLPKEIDIFDAEPFGAIYAKSHTEFKEALKQSMLDGTIRKLKFERMGVVIKAKIIPFLCAEPEPIMSLHVTKILKEHLERISELQKDDSE